MTFPWPESPRLTEVCANCETPVGIGRLVHGMGSGCARRLGLTVATPRVRADPQTGPDLFTNDEEDCCDGWDR